MTTLKKRATRSILTCMNLKKSERLLIVYDKNKESIVNSLLVEAKKITKHVGKIKTKVAKIHGEEPYKKVAKEMRRCDVLLLITTKSLSHTEARRKACKKGVRAASLPGITEDILNRAQTADYQKISKINDKIHKKIKIGKKLRIKTKKGTDLTVYIQKPFIDSGLYHKSGEFGNLPAGEVGFAPVEHKTKGTLVIDKTMAGIGKLKNPIKLKIEKGYVTKITGKKEANKLIKLLRDLKTKSVYNVAEYSFGTNYKARISGSPLEDEKVFGTVHVAIGDNTSYPGGKTKAPVHLDGIISKPTVFVDGKKIMEKGKLYPKLYK